MIFCIGILIFTGIVLMQKRSYTALILGVIVLGNGINLSVFYASAPKTGLFAFVTDNISLETSNDPLPQALVLTAIVIGFALLGFLVSLVRVLSQELGVFDSSHMSREECDE